MFELKGVQGRGGVPVSRNGPKQLLGFSSTEPHVPPSGLPQAQAVQPRESLAPVKTPPRDCEYGPAGHEAVPDWAMHSVARYGGEGVGAQSSPVGQSRGGSAGGAHPRTPSPQGSGPSVGAPPEGEHVPDKVGPDTVMALALVQPAVGPHVEGSVTIAQGMVQPWSW
jgi:hypothetical protein